MRTVKYCITVLFLFLCLSGHTQEKQNFSHSDVTEAKGWTRQLHFKTNLLYDMAAISNIGIEFDIAKHWSFSLPVNYSAWDYFSPTLKFRTLSVQPEFRYWFNMHNEGWFIGVHFGYGYYNFALDGDWRIQDHNRETPSIGGGLSAGYRTHLSKNKRWKMEFAVGGGAYESHYDKFYNEPNGRLQGDYHKLYIGVDHVSVSIAYAFNFTKKGGKR